MPDHFYVYPGYLARGASRADGRRVPTAATVLDVTLEDITAAAKRLGYRIEVEAGKQYPRTVPSYAGRLKVTKKAGVSKTRFLRLVAAEVEKVRGVAGKR